MSSLKGPILVPSRLELRLSLLFYRFREGDDIFRVSSIPRSAAAATMRATAGVDQVEKYRDIVRSCENKVFHLLQTAN